MMETTLNETKITTPSGTETTTSAYDHEGAMKFVVATILLYSLLGVVTMLISRLRKGKNERRSKDEDIARFLKSEKRMRLVIDREKIKTRKMHMMKHVSTRNKMGVNKEDVEGNVAESHINSQSAPEIKLPDSPGTDVQYENEQSIPKSKVVSFTVGDEQMEYQRPRSSETEETSVLLQIRDI